MDDLELIRRFVDGAEQKAFAELVRRYVDLVYSAAARQVGPAHADDICQGVFLELARRAGKLRKDSSVGTWLYVVTRRTAVDWIRRESRRVKRERTAWEDAAMDQRNEHVPPETDWSRLGPRLDDAMEQLSADERRAIVMRFFENRRLKDIAATLGASEDAAQKRVSRALDKLRDALAARGFTTLSVVLATELSVHAVAPAPAALAGKLVAASKGITGSSAFGGWIGTVVGAAAVVSALTFSWRQMQDAHAAADRIVALGERLQSIQAQLRSEDAGMRRTAGLMVHLPLAKAQEADNDPDLKVKAIALLRGVSDLRRHLKANPGRMIPEMRLLADQDWLEVARRFSAPETDDDYRQAFSALREAAKAHVAALLKAALQAYENDHGGALPSDTLQLAPYSDPPMDADILQRYALESHPPTRSSSDAIMEKTSALVDDHYETLFTIGIGGFSTRSSGGSNGIPFGAEMDMLNAQRSFKAEHPGQRPAGEVLVPYFADPANAQIYLESRRSKP